MVRSDCRRQVLLAEDDPVNIELVRAILETVDCEVTAVATGAKAIEAFMEKPFHLVLLDFHMPDMNGDVAAMAMRAIEASRQSRHVWIAALTGSAMPDELRLCLKAGMNEILTKPIDMARLRRLVADSALAPAGP